MNATETTPPRDLSAWQVAAMLVSASYGIGFLFGSGELAVQHGLAGGLYGVATAIGLGVLAAYAGRLWQLGVPIWSLFGQAHGCTAQRLVAGLSVLWMGGVLAAQLQGGAVILGLFGVPSQVALVAMTIVVGLLSWLDLASAARVFAACLLLSAVALVVALIHFDGGAAYVNGARRFVADLPSYGGPRLLAVTLGVGLMAVGGSDYHQFLQAGRSPSHARWGGVVAALLLVALALLPPAVVVAAGKAGVSSVGADSVDGRGVLPMLLAQATDALWPGGHWVMLASLSMAALGSAAAVLRAMRSAWSAAVSSSRIPDAPCLLLAAGLAAWGRGIVDTMVAVNVVYLAAVSVCTVALLRGAPMSSPRAVASLCAGLIGAVSTQMAFVVMNLPTERDLASLLVGVGLAAVPACSDWWERRCRSSR